MHSAKLQYYWDERAMRDVNGNQIDVFSVAKLYCDNGQPEEACRLLRTIVLYHPSDVNAQIMLANTLSDIGMHAESALIFEELLKLYPGSEILILLIREYLASGATELAERHLRQIIRPDTVCNRWLAMELGNLMIDGKRWEEAFKVFSELSVRPELFDVARTILSDVLQNIGQLDHAIEVLSPASESNWSHTFVSLSLAQLRRTMIENNATAPRRPHPYPGSDIGMSINSLKLYGRFGHQLQEYFFLKCQSEQTGVPLETPEWVGHYVFELDDPLPTGCRIPVKRPAKWIEQQALSTGASALAGKDFFSPGPFPDWKPGYTRKARDLFKMRPYVLKKLNPVLNSLKERGNTLVALHIRLTDQGSRFRIPSHDWYKSWIKDIWPTLDKPVLYIASDDIRSVLPVFSEFSPVHRGNIVDSWPGLDWLYDFFILMHSDAVALSQSAFSCYASILNTRANVFMQPDMHKETLVPYDPMLHNLCPWAAPT